MRKLDVCWLLILPMFAFAQIFSNQFLLETLILRRSKIVEAWIQQDHENALLHFKTQELLDLMREIENSCQSNKKDRVRYQKANQLFNTLIIDWIDAKNARPELVNSRLNQLKHISKEIEALERNEIRERSF